jgi:hypothetical protein
LEAKVGKRNIKKNVSKWSSYVLTQFIPFVRTHVAKDSENFVTNNMPAGRLSSVKKLSLLVAGAPRPKLSVAKLKKKIGTE